jgi:hypothetical protein
MKLKKEECTEMTEIRWPMREDKIKTKNPTKVNTPKLGMVIV